MSSRYNTAVNSFEDTLASKIDTRNSNDIMSRKDYYDRLIIEDRERRSSSLPAMRSRLLLSEEQILQIEELGINLEDPKDVLDELDGRRRQGEIYEHLNAQWLNIMKRLKFLSKKNENLSIDEAFEIYDASVVLNVEASDKIYGWGDREDYDNDAYRKANHGSVRLAGQIAKSGLLLMLQAKMLKRKGRELLDLSKSKLKDAYP
ncbi:uncharacterized protein LOC123924848 isoform X2 [Trifolium pratense]|uniref:uncharacterized protein LOC123924848 isoform X2 n=1 Tax=Trifolium pratense TaxID=57577 RepID=UPI001E69221B|nr:uncharacterized protein LOC123924848 isoform X2 [Trifolium pratense]